MTRELELEAALRNLMEVVEWADKNKDTISKDSIVMDAARDALATPSTLKFPMSLYPCNNKCGRLYLQKIDRDQCCTGGSRKQVVAYLNDGLDLPIDETPPMPHCTDPDHGTDGSTCPTCFTTGGW